MECCLGILPCINRSTLCTPLTAQVWHGTQEQELSPLCTRPHSVREQDCGGTLRGVGVPDWCFGKSFCPGPSFHRECLGDAECLHFQESNPRTGEFSALLSAVQVGDLASVPALHGPRRSLNTELGDRPEQSGVVHK